jgi:hypothetical protein
MKQPIPGKQLPKAPVEPSDARSIDVQYGLEPVIDTSSVSADGGAPKGVQFHLGRPLPWAKIELRSIPLMAGVFS